MKWRKVIIQFKTKVRKKYGEVLYQVVTNLKRKLQNWRIKSFLKDKVSIWTTQKTSKLGLMTEINHSPETKS